MAFPIFSDGLILFADGAPAVSDNCCCGYYRTSYGPCCNGGPTGGCRWPDAPASSLTFEEYYYSPLFGGFERFESVVTQNGPSFLANLNGLTGCYESIVVPVAYWHYHYAENSGGFPIVNREEEGTSSTNTKLVIPTNPRLGSLTFQYQYPSIFGRAPASFTVSMEGECSGAKERHIDSSSGSTTDTKDLEFMLDARNCSD